MLKLKTAGNAKQNTPTGHSRPLGANGAETGETGRKNGLTAPDMGH